MFIPNTSVKLDYKWSVEEWKYGCPVFSLVSQIPSLREIPTFLDLLLCFIIVHFLVSVLLTHSLMNNQALTGPKTFQTCTELCGKEELHSSVSLAPALLLTLFSRTTLPVLSTTSFSQLAILIPSVPGKRDSQLLSIRTWKVLIFLMTCFTVNRLSFSLLH